MITYYQANRMLNYNFGKNPQYDPVNSYFIAVSTTTPNPDQTGVSEPVGGGYARVEISNTKTTFSDAVNGILSNLIQIQFPESTTNWGTVTNVCIFDSSTGGNLLYWQQLPQSRTAESGTTLLLVPGALNIQLI